MAAFNFFIFIFIFIFFTFIQVLHTKPNSNICKHDQPNIHFPFKITSSCKHNQTMIKFQDFRELGFKSISYNPNKLTLFDPKDCVFQVFLNLNLDQTPFRYYHVVRNYTYLNCLTVLSGSFEQVPCLSDSKHHVYVVDSMSSLDHVHGSCEVVKTVMIPFAYSSYVSDDSFGLDLSWDSVGLMDFVEEERRVGVQSIVEGFGMVMLIFVVVGLGCVKVYCWKKSRSQDHEWEKLVGDLEIL